MTNFLSTRKTYLPTLRGADRVPILLHLTLLLLPVGVDPVFAQARNTSLEEVVVTASRREESLQDVASSVTALSGNMLESRGITDFSDIQRTAAGLYLETPTNAGSASLRIRGVGSASFSGIDPSVGVVVDGVYQQRPGFAFTELMDIERIEVLRGPQGTLFGRNTTAGVIHIHTRDPDPSELSGHLQGVVGNLDARELRGVINLPLIEDKLAIRFSANDVVRDGYTHNIHLDRDTRSQDREGGRFKLLWNATDNVEILWRSEIQRTQSRIDEGLVIYGNDNITSGLPVSGQPWAALAAALGRTLPDISLGRAGENRSMFEDELERHVLTINWALPGHNLQSITAYEEFDGYRFADRDRTSLDLSSLINDNLSRSKSQELILSSEGEAPLSYVLGAFYQESTLHSPTELFDGPDLIALRGGVAAPSIVSTTTGDDNSKAVFGTLTYDLSDRLRVIGGARFTSDTKKTYSTLLIPGRPLVEAIDNERTFEEWTYTAKIQYHIDADRMAYFSADRGFKSGGFNRQNTGCVLSGGRSGCLPPRLLSFVPEITDSFEAGLKSEWLDGRVRFNGAIFYQTYEDFQVAQTLHDQATPLITNAAKVESKGLEFDLVGSVTDRFTLDVSVALIETEYDSYPDAPCGRPSQNGCENGVLDHSGERLDNAPRVTTNIGLEYRGDFGSWQRAEWFARGDVSYRSGANLHVSLDELTDQGGYTLFGAMFGLQSSSGEWKATLWGKNLGDKEYAIAGVSNAGGITRIQGLTRTYGLTLDWYF